MKRTIFICGTIFTLLLTTIFLIIPVQAAECTWFSGTGGGDGERWRANGSSPPDGTGKGIRLPDAAHLLTITPPDGYAVVNRAEQTLYVNGADMVLPPSGLRLSGVLVGSVFADNDGDGRQGVGGNERGIGGVSVQISGLVNTIMVSDLTGRFLLPDRPGGGRRL